MPLPSNPQTLASYDITKGDQAKIFVKKVADLFLSIAQTLTPAGLSSILNGSALLNVTSSQTSITDLGTVSASSSTIDTSSSGQVFVRVNYTGATAYTITLNNLAQGAVVYLRLLNGAAAARTITVAANTPASGAYGVTLYVPAGNALSSGVSVTNGQAINGFGMGAMSGGVPFLALVGSIG